MTRERHLICGINAAIVRARDKTVLPEEACRIAIKSGGIDLVRFGLPAKQITVDHVVASIPSNNASSGSPSRNLRSEPRWPLYRSARLPIKAEKMLLTLV